MNDDRGIVIIGGPNLPLIIISRECMNCLVAAGPPLPPFPPFPKLPPHDTCFVFSDYSKAAVAAEKDLFIPRETAWQRRNRNAPWYRQFNRKR